MPAQLVNSQDFDDEVLKSKTPVLVDFFAVWCGPCKMAEPIMDKLAEEFGGKVKIVKVDVDESQDIAQKYNVMSMPTVVVFKEGKEIDRKVGFLGEDGYREMIEEIL